VRAVIYVAACITAGLSLAADGDFANCVLFALAGSLYSLLTTYMPRVEKPGSYYHLAVAAGDVLLVSGIVWITGGVTSEYYLLYFVPVVVAAVRLDIRSGLLACITVGCFYPLVALGAPPQPPVLPFAVVRGISVFVGAFVVSFLLLLLGREAKLSYDLRDTLHHSLRRVAAVYEVAHAANTGADLTGVLTIILDHAARATNAANGTVFLVSEGNNLRPMASLYTPSGGIAESVQPPIGPAHEAMRTSALVTSSVPQHTFASGTTAVYVPLRAPAGPLGVLALVSPPGRGFAQQHLDFLTSLCSEAALAIENAQLRSELRRLAVTDPLTGLPNRREIERLLAVEVERAARHNRPLSLMMVDLDDLKQVNDEHGHAAGDEVLVALARMIQQGLRSSEIAGRVGGDEFTVLLPETEPRQAAALAERLIEGLPEALRDWPDLPEAAEIARMVGVSIGIAGNDDGPVSPDKLAARADAALYDAKRSGKNRVCAVPHQSALR